MATVDDEAEDFWARAREFEALLAAKVEEVGEGPELHQWLLDIEAWDEAVRLADGPVKDSSSD